MDGTLSYVTNQTSTERPRLVRIVSPTNASIHDLLLIDSPKFHFVLDFATNVEVYHLTIRGANLGSYDGIDAIGTNYYIHDNEVSFAAKEEKNELTIIRSRIAMSAFQ